MKHIPNTVTLCNLLAGCLAIWSATQGNLVWAGLFIFLGALADFLDGLLARALKVSGPLGAQLDSLSDLVTFGVAPGFIALTLIPDAQLQFLAFLLPICAAIRLGKFNLGGQSTSFLGIPSPACGMFWAATSIGGIAFVPQELALPYLLCAVLVTGLFMVLPFHILSLKITGLGWQGNQTRWMLLAGIVALIFTLGWASTPFILVLYLVISAVDKRLLKTGHEI